MEVGGLVGDLVGNSVSLGCVGVDVIGDCVGDVVKGAEVGGGVGSSCRSNTPRLWNPPHNEKLLPPGAKLDEAANVGHVINCPLEKHVAVNLIA